MNAARKAGFDNLGIDLIYGVHGQNIKSWKNTLQKAVSFTPEHISCYQLSLDDKTPLYKKYSSEGWNFPMKIRNLKLFLTTAELLENAGYIHYEVSNFARKDKFKSKHNMKYWQHTPYLGLGPAAHSFLKNKRWWNKASVKTYLKEIAQEKCRWKIRKLFHMNNCNWKLYFLALRTKPELI